MLTCNQTVVIEIKRFTSFGRMKLLWLKTYGQMCLGRCCWDQRHLERSLLNRLGMQLEISDRWYTHMSCPHMVTHLDSEHSVSFSQAYTDKTKSLASWKLYHCRLLCASVSLHYRPPSALQPSCWRGKQGKQKRNREAESERRAGWTVNFLNPPPFITHTHTHSLCPCFRLYLHFFSPPPSSPSVIAFDLNTSIKANPTRQRKVTCKARGQGEVAFMPRGSASNSHGLRRLWMFSCTCTVCVGHSGRKLSSTFRFRHTRSVVLYYLHILKRLWLFFPHCIENKSPLLLWPIFLLFSFSPPFPSSHVSGEWMCGCVCPAIVCLLQTDLSSWAQGDRSLCVSQ